MNRITPVFNKSAYKNDTKMYKLNEESKYSITHKFQGEQLIKIIEDFTKSNLKNMEITDGTSGAGGDTINFCKHFKHVIGVEIKHGTFNLLEENCKNFKCKNALLINRDYSEIYNKLKQDIIYVDPPWGGTDYKNKASIQLKIGSYSLSSFTNKIIAEKLCKYVFIKTPFNCDLKGIRINKIYTVYNIYGMPSYMIICIKV
jgi:adenine-specific DNA methylase